MRRLTALGVVAVIVACNARVDDGAAPPTTPVGAGLVGAPCVHHADCASGVCVGVGADGAGTVQSVCTAVCQSSADCVAGWSCAPLGDKPESVCQCSLRAEICDGKDNDCNGVVDDAKPADDACGAPLRCVAGACACPLTECTNGGPPPGACVDLATDGTNCGACGVQCVAGAACTGAACRCASGLDCSPVAGADRTLCGPDGACRSWWQIFGPPTTGDGQPLSEIISVTIGDAGLYFASRPNNGGGVKPPYHLWRHDKTYATTSVDLGMGTGIIADGATTLRSVFLSSWSLVACPDDACASPVVLSTTGPATFAAAAGTAYWIEPSNGDVYACAETGCASPTLVAAGSTFGTTGASILTATPLGVYFTSGGTLYFAPSGGAPESVVAGETFSGSFAVDQDHVYWTTPTGIRACASASLPCAAPTTFASTPSAARIIADGTHVYWIGGVDPSNTPGLLACPRSGCGAAPLVLVSPVNSYYPYLVADADHLYAGGLRITK